MFSKEFATRRLFRASSATRRAGADHRRRLCFRLWPCRSVQYQASPDDAHFSPPPPPPPDKDAANHCEGVNSTLDRVTRKWLRAAAAAADGMEPPSSCVVYLALFTARGSSPFLFSNGTIGQPRSLFGTPLGAL